MMRQNFAYLAELFPPLQPHPCPKCGGKPYVFGIPENDPSREVLACSVCGFLFHYPCPQCGHDTARLEAREQSVFKYACDACQHHFTKSPGWLERPHGYQQKISSYFHSQRSPQERAVEALK